MSVYDSFFKKHPKGEITKDEFLEENKDNIMAEAFFRIFDEDGSGTLRFSHLDMTICWLYKVFYCSFYEFVMVKTAPKMEEPEEKLRWIFQSFDKGRVNVEMHECILFMHK